MPEGERAVADLEEAGPLPPMHCKGDSEIEFAFGTLMFLSLFDFLLAEGANHHLAEVMPGVRIAFRVVENAG